MYQMGVSFYEDVSSLGSLSWESLPLPCTPLKKGRSGRLTSPSYRHTVVTVQQHMADQFHHLRVLPYRTYSVLQVYGHTE